MLLSLFCFLVSYWTLFGVSCLGCDAWWWGWGKEFLRIDCWTHNSPEGSYFCWLSIGSATKPQYRRVIQCHYLWTPRRIVLLVKIKCPLNFHIEEGELTSNTTTNSNYPSAIHTVAALSSSFILWTQKAAIEEEQRPTGTFKTTTIGTSCAGI